ncbi:unnamed protein product [Phytophthora lilii]|uniref:Unnamed protein product n=1 Tax=Phytophthora lilii TaxID=2077276 RepID=A0A9W6WN82_9STRA|nr:unnamed protein product [Phytophthora lilii]
MAVDEFGREHFVVEAPSGLLGILLVENERGFVHVQGFGQVSAEDHTFSSESYKEQLAVLRQVVRAGDRLVAINGDDVAHCSLAEVINRLVKLSATRRYLKFGRYHEARRSINNYDPEKLVIVRAPSGPLGLILSDVLHYAAVIEDFQQLPDGSQSHLKSYQKVHRGCQLVTINGVDVSGLARDEVTRVLAGMRNQDKEIVLYRMTPNTCAKFLQLTVHSDNVKINFSETENARCVIESVDATIEQEIEEGDVLISVNATDVTSMSRVAAMKLLSDAPYPKTLSFYHQSTSDLPECHAMLIDEGLSGLNLDRSEPNHPRITGFTSPADADRPTCKHLKEFIPHSYIISINGLEVHQHTLADVSNLFLKMRHASKRIVVGNVAFMKSLDQARSVAAIMVPPGPLGIKFDGVQDDVARVAGFNLMADGMTGIIEQSRRVPVGSRLVGINKMNVTCLTLSQIVGLLQKLSSAPKELTFSTSIQHTEYYFRTVSIRVPPGPLGIDLKTVAPKKVVVDRINEDPAKGPTYIFSHGGVASGSEILAIDGFNVSSLPISEVSQLLRLLVSHEKVITFGTTTVAYEKMLSIAHRPSLRNVAVSGTPIGVEFDNSVENAACTTHVVKSICNDDIPIGSCLVAIENIDVQALPLRDIIEILDGLAGSPKTLTFETEHRLLVQSAPTNSPPRSSVLKKILKTASPVAAAPSSSPPRVDTPPHKSTVRFAEVDPLDESPTSIAKVGVLGNM